MLESISVTRREEKQPTYLPTYNLTPTSGELNLNTKWMDGWKANEAFQNILGVAQTAETSTVCYKDDYEEEDIFGRFLKKKKKQLQHTFYSTYKPSYHYKWVISFPLDTFEYEFMYSFHLLQWVGRVMMMTARLLVG